MPALIKNIFYIITNIKFRLRFIIIVVFAIIQAILESLVILTLPIILNFLIFREHPTKLLSTISILENYDHIRLTIFFIIFFLFKNIFNLFYNFYSSKYITEVQSCLNSKIFQTHLYKSHQDFTSINTSEYIKDITNDSNNYINFSLSPLISLITEFFIILFIFITLVLINFQLTIFLIISSFFIYYIFNYFTKNILLNAGKSNERSQTELIKFIRDSYLSFKEIHLYNLQPHFILQFSDIAKRLASGISKNMFYGSLPRILIECFFIIFIIVNLTLMINFSSTELIISFGTFGFASLRLIPSLSKIFASISSIKFGNSSCNSLVKLLNICVRKQDIQASEQVNYTDSLVLTDINHRYNDIPILVNINLAINSGDFIAIVGDSGSGKTTLLNIILGLITPTSGIITSNNFPISLSSHSWRSLLGYVPQSIYLIDDDIYKNIAFGTSDSYINKNKIDSILESLSLNNFLDKSDIRKLQIGELGGNISGGQSQRIGIAKALYRNPKILVLDEFTSALDDSNQDKILTLIKNLNITVIMVTHRLSSLSYCNKVFKLANNSIVQIK